MRGFFKTLLLCTAALTALAGCAVFERGEDAPPPPLPGGGETRVFETDFPKSTGTYPYVGEKGAAMAAEAEARAPKETEKKTSELSLQDEIENLVQSLPEDGAPTQPAPEAQPAEPVEHTALSDAMPKSNERKPDPVFDGNVVTAEPGDAPVRGDRLPAVPPRAGVALGLPEASEPAEPHHASVQSGVADTVPVATVPDSFEWSDFAHEGEATTEDAQSAADMAFASHADAQGTAEAATKSASDAEAGTLADFAEPKPHQDRAMPSADISASGTAHDTRYGHGESQHGAEMALMDAQKTELGASLDETERAALHERLFPTPRWRREFEAKTAGDPPVHKTPRGF